jgi:hypothetical protein
LKTGPISTAQFQLLSLPRELSASSDLNALTPFTGLGGKPSQRAATAHKTGADPDIITGSHLPEPLDGLTRCAPFGF